MLTLNILLQRIRFSLRQLLILFYAPLVHCTPCPLAREDLNCKSIVFSLGSPLQNPRFSLYTVPAHCLAPRCPLSQTEMTLGSLPAAQVKMSVSLAVGGGRMQGGEGGSDKEIMPCQTKVVGGQSRKSLHRPEWVQ